MKTMKHMVAFDCGNSSYRVVLGTWQTTSMVSRSPS